MKGNGAAASNQELTENIIIVINIMFYDNVLWAISFNFMRVFVFVLWAQNL